MEYLKIVLFAVCAFFEEEPNLVVRMQVISYNDLAYSISVDENEYVLPNAWFQTLLDSMCTKQS